MKKVSLLLIVLAILLVPFSVIAKDKKVNVYFFRGETCQYCAQAKEFFESIKEEYGKYYNLVDYEVYYNQDNSDLMKKVAEARGDDTSGIPYIIIGDKSWKGYTSDYNKSIIKKIKEVYKQNPKDRYDVMDFIKNKKNNDKTGDIISLIIILIVASGVATGIFYTRKSTK